MVALACDICGGQLEMDSNGEFAICESCGMKYTKERVKTKLEEHAVNIKLNDDDIVKKQVDNWEVMAASAFNNSSYEEAYTYYCKILEKKVDYWMARYRKGLCQGWKSTLANIRVTEVFGSIVDATKLLMVDETQTDSSRANSKFIMALEVFKWIQAVSNMIVNHANEYAEQLASAAREFYERECLVSQMLKFNMSMLDESIYNYYEDRNGFTNLVNAIIEAGKATVDNMESSFRVKTGSMYNTFWQRYEDVYENIIPDYKTILSKNELIIEIDTFKSNINIWKESFNKRQAEEITKEKEERIKKFWEDHPYIYSDYLDKCEIEKETQNKKNIAESDLLAAENRLSPIVNECNKCEETISNCENQIERLGKKIFGKKKATEDISIRKTEILKCKRRLLELKPSKKDAEELVSSMRTNLTMKIKDYEQAHNDVVAILKLNSLE